MTVAICVISFKTMKLSNNDSQNGTNVMLKQQELFFRRPQYVLTWIIHERSPISARTLQECSLLLYNIFLTDLSLFRPFPLSSFPTPQYVHEQQPFNMNINLLTSPPPRPVASALGQESILSLKRLTRSPNPRKICLLFMGSSPVSFFSPLPFCSCSLSDFLLMLYILLFPQWLLQSPHFVLVPLLLRSTAAICSCRYVLLAFCSPWLSVSFYTQKLAWLCRGEGKAGRVLLPLHADLPVC